MKEQARIPGESLRTHNPFRDALVTELIEDVDLYGDMFSDNILVGQACNVFQPGNVIVVGPQGCGKTMLLNLTRLRVLSQWLKCRGGRSQVLDDVAPFFGISINLAQASFHTFGRRSVSKVLGLPEVDPLMETAAAADYLAYFLLDDFIKALDLCRRDEGKCVRTWLGVSPKKLDDPALPVKISKCDCWNGVFARCRTWSALQAACRRRMRFWWDFLGTNVDEIPSKIWKSKADLQRGLHCLGNFVRDLGDKRPLALFVYIDQYEVLRELNPTHGRELQRLINTLIKSRDPVVSYRIGARTYDWGTELRVTGAESRIEFQRDYSKVDLTALLVRNEDKVGYIYPQFAIDVACRRLRRLEDINVDPAGFRRMFGRWSAMEESGMYFRSRSQASRTIKKLPTNIKKKILTVCAAKGTALDIRLAAAWCLQKVQRGADEEEILAGLDDPVSSWQWKWWYKERKEIGLVQLASHANQQRRYFGWNTLLDLSGGNISAFLLLCSEIWDTATKQGVNPLGDTPLDPKIQTDAIVAASRKWLERDSNWPAGARRYAAVNSLGTAISASIQADIALSNPGHTGFSVQEPPLHVDEKGGEVREFLTNAVSWAILEERRHKSKHKGDAARRKYYLHPILSPSFGIPIKRVKEPYYATIEQIHKWLFSGNAVVFGTERRQTPRKKKSRGAQT